MMIKKLIVCVLVSTASVQAVADSSVAKYSNIPGMDCVVNPYRVADIASPVAGVIEKLYAERSQRVDAGQVIVQLNADVERASVELARYRAEIQSEVKLGQVNMKFDRQRNKRIQSLSVKQAVSMENIDEAEREAGLSKWKLQQAREFVEVRQLELKRAEEQLKQKSIKAPFDGYVLDTFKHRGEHVDEQSILRLAQLNPLVIEAIVPMENFGEIKVGMEAEILPESPSSEKLVGKVSIVDRIGDTASNTFGVRLVMPNPENRIPAGIKCVVKFFQQSDENIAAETSDPKSGVMVEKNMVAAMLSKKQIAVIVENSMAIEVLDNNADVVNDKLSNNYVEVESNKDTVISDEKVLGNTELKNTEILDGNKEWQKEIAVQQRGDEPLANAQAESEQSKQEKASSYLVVTEQEETNPLTEALISHLRDSGIYDLQKVDRGPYKGLILLGIYNHRSRAERRQNTLANLGIATFIKGRY